ncbi:ACP S-malonyltransferase [Pleurocapsa sp. FMAR1]|uniref:ACP S-malonyltransferase n=1 Tax=Pleurocapsa sp. FMAR1 TaxID=3040204 RepID=UPI0029C90281|nr:ACP S-malonyltransferase [Pleurocapsa sp. FMAR1]
MTKTAWVFPGQGSQESGMGTDLVSIPLAKARFKQAQNILDWDVTKVCLNENLELSQTLYTQPCLYVISAILADLMKDAGFKPSIVAGHSLGEYAALYAAEVISFEVGLQLVKLRAELMNNTPPGVMTALIGFDRDRLEEQVALTPDVVIANDNHNSQIVISGTSAGVETLLKKIKYRRVVPLDVSGAFHSPLMADISLEFNRTLQTVAFQPAKVPVISNVEPSPSSEASVLKNRLMEQMTGRVRWREIVNSLDQNDVKKIIEIGPGDVLTNTIFKILPSIELENVSSNTNIATTNKQVRLLESI